MSAFDPKRTPGALLADELSQNPVADRRVRRIARLLGLAIAERGTIHFTRRAGVRLARVDRRVEE